MKLLTLRYSAILLAGLLLQWWLFYLSSFPIPENIPSTPIKIGGLFFIAYVIAVLIFFQKDLLKAEPSRRILNLTMWGIFMFFCAEVIFQIIRMPTLAAESFGERIYYFLRGTIVMTAFAAIFCFLIAFQLKTKRTGVLLFLILVVILIFHFLKSLFPAYWQS